CSTSVTCCASPIGEAKPLTPSSRRSSSSKGRATASLLGERGSCWMSGRPPEEQRAREGSPLGSVSPRRRCHRRACRSWTSPPFRTAPSLRLSLSLQANGEPRDRGSPCGSAFLPRFTGDRRRCHLRASEPSWLSPPFGGTAHGQAPTASQRRGNGSLTRLGSCAFGVLSGTGPPSAASSLCPPHA